MEMPTLETERLRIRPFTLDDLRHVHQLLDVELGTAGAPGLGERERWLRWTVLSYRELAELHQPPYGDRAVTLRDAGTLIGACGYAPCLAPFGQLPGLGRDDGRPAGATAEVGLFWALAPAYRGRGYATEAGRALLDYGFATLGLARIVATTTHDNSASIGVMRGLGMRISCNPRPDPPWLQVVGLRDRP